jgi:cell division inhibitor SepF
MAGAMRKMAVYLGLVEDDRYDDEYYDDGPRNDERSGSGDRQNDRIGSAKTDRYGDRYSSRADDTVRITEREDDDLARRRQSAERQPTRDWRSDTVAQESVGSHPAGSRPKATPRPAPRTVDPMKITTLHPRSYNDARRIGEEFRSGNPVIMNLTELDDTDAKRIVDFAAGLVFGLRGSIERVTNKVFMLSPANVSVNAEDARASLQQRGLANKS